MNNFCTDSKMRLKLFKLCNGYPTCLRYITVEPALIFFASSHILTDFLNTNLFLQKACRFDTTAEPDLNTFCDDEKRGITYVSWIHTNFLFAKMVFAVITSIIFTSWSDEAGKRRRPLIILPIIGQILETISGSLQSYFWYWPPIYGVVSNFILHLCFGGMTLFGTGCFVYICEVSSFESRTMRIGIISAIKIICTPISNGFAGFIIREIGFFYCYVLAFVFSVISLIYAFVFVKDISVPVKKKTTIWSALNLCKLSENFKIVFKKSLGSNRIIVALLLLVQIFVVFSSEGETGFYIFLLNFFPT